MLRVGESASARAPNPDPVGLAEATGVTFRCEDTVQLFYTDVDSRLAAEMVRLVTRQILNGTEELS